MAISIKVAIYMTHKGKGNMVVFNRNRAIERDIEMYSGIEHGKFLNINNSDHL